VPVTNLRREEILLEAEMPIKYAAYTPCFRREAGSTGRETKGLIRMHQFDKLELESFSLPEESKAEQDLFVAIQEHMMQKLRLPYRVVLLCTGDMGGPDYRHIDIETWMPGQNVYRETHSADLMTSFQSRRLNIKYKNAEGKTEYVHMNDATLFALGRTLIAIIENYQQADGSIKIPEVLVPYLNKEFIKKD
jgi:seryl-tRNA synthetase